MRVISFHFRTVLGHPDLKHELEGAVSCPWSHASRYNKEYISSEAVPIPSLTPVRVGGDQAFSYCLARDSLGRYVIERSM